MNIVQPGSHLDQMLRQTRHHHVILSTMADTKANILISISAVLMTLSAPHAMNPIFKVPVGILIAFCLITVMLAIYTVMPKTSLTRRRGAPDIKSNDFNLLFFGDFTRLDFPEFEAAMEEVLNNPNLTYEAQVREIYTLGIFLATRKYRALRLAYVAFITGLVLSALALFCGF